MYVYAQGPRTDDHFMESNWRTHFSVYSTVHTHVCWVFFYVGLFIWIVNLLYLWPMRISMRTQCHVHATRQFFSGCFCCRLFDSPRNAETLFCFVSQMWPSKTSWSHISTLKNKAAKANAVDCKSKRVHNIFFALSLSLSWKMFGFGVADECVRFSFGCFIICLLAERIFYYISPLLGSISMMIRRHTHTHTKPHTKDVKWIRRERACTHINPKLKCIIERLCECKRVKTRKTIA